MSGMNETWIEQQGQYKRKSPSTSDDDDEEEEVHLDWRMDPEESLSDWKIEITGVDGSIHETYHVHRASLAVGSKQSIYFARVFANAGLREHETQTSCIELEESAAKAFPLMLDYLYNLWDTTKKPITNENAVTLHYFGRYFEIRGLRREARTFWKQRMTVDQAATYLEQAQLFHDEQAHDAVVEKCLRSVGSIQVDSRLMDVSDTNFWLAVLKKNRNAPNPALSTMVAHFCADSRMDVLDADAFTKLTEQSALPKLSVSAAMVLLHLENLSITSTTSEQQLSNLQERSLEALISCSNATPAHFTDVQHCFKHLPPHVLSHMLQRSMTKLWDCNRDLEVMKSCVPNEIFVAGAEIDGVNGTYSRSAKVRYRVPHYTMDGTWNGNPTQFQLYCCYTAGIDDGVYNRLEWFISIVRGEDAEDNDFYCASVSKDNSRIPPRSGWFCEDGDGLWKKATTLALSFHFDEFGHSGDWFL